MNFKSKFINQLFLAGAAGIISIGSAKATPGDTTTIISHHQQILDWYQDYDSVVSFPDGSTSYNRIIMEFELGKYHCDGYDPSNAGEGTGQTGWCADWDYDVHVIAMTSTGDTIELGELITPYANSNFPATAGWDWKYSYMFDVTDYYSILKDEVTIRIFYAGWSGGFTGTVKFHFVEGVRNRDVVGISKLYHGNFAYGLSSNPIEDQVGPKTITFPSDAVSGVFRTIITGHGGISGSNCSEFCKKWVKYNVNGTDIVTKDIWKDDCGNNWLAVQSGTWVYDRANWCPGNLVDPWIINIPSSVSPGSEFVADMNFQPFTASSEGASYKMSTYAIFYGPYNHSVDAGIENIIIPNNTQEMRLENSACGIAKLEIRNFGAETITSIKVGVTIGSGIEEEFEISTSIPSNQSGIVTLSDFNSLSNAVGTNTFKAQILAVNGTADENEFNDIKYSTFEAAPKHNFNTFNIQMRTSSRTNNGADSIRWDIIDVNTNEVVISRKGTTKNKIYSDTFNLGKGCYLLRVDNPNGLGLAFFSSFTKGWVRMFDVATGNRISMPGNDMGATGLEGNFGNGFNYYFNVTSELTSVEEFENKININVYPNPNNGKFNIDIKGLVKKTSLKVVNVIGEVVHKQELNLGKNELNGSEWPSGIYTLIIENNGEQYIEKITITK